MALLGPEKHQHDDIHTPFSSVAYDAPKRRWTTQLAKSILCATAIYYLVHQAPLFMSKSFKTVDTYVQSDIFDWAELQPSKELEWQKCYDGKFDCARLDVR